MQSDVCRLAIIRWVPPRFDYQKNVKYHSHLSVAFSETILIKGPQEDTARIIVILILYIRIFYQGPGMMERTYRITPMIPVSCLRKNRVDYPSTSVKEIPKFENGTKYKGRSSRNMTQSHILGHIETIDTSFTRDPHSFTEKEIPKLDNGTNNRRRSSRIRTVEAESSKKNVKRQRLDKKEVDANKPNVIGNSAKETPQQAFDDYPCEHETYMPSMVPPTLRHSLISSMVPESELWTNRMDNPSTPEKLENRTNNRRRSSRIRTFEAESSKENVKRQRLDKEAENRSEENPSLVRKNSLLKSFSRITEKEIPKLDNGTNTRRRSSRIRTIETESSKENVKRQRLNKKAENRSEETPSLVRKNNTLKSFSRITEKEIPKLDNGTNTRRRSSRIRTLETESSKDNVKRQRLDKKAENRSEENPSLVRINSGEVSFSRITGHCTLWNNHKLTEMLSMKGKKSRKVRNECRKICTFIQTLSRDICHVEPTYTTEKFKTYKTVTFLIMAEKEDANLKTVAMKCPWKTEIRIVNKYSDESRMMLHCKENGPIAEETSRIIAGIIDKYSGKLIKEHKYLSSISASSVKSIGFETNNHEILKDPCIILNVLVKGFIPLDENPFPRHLDGINIDVREGGVQFCRSFAGDVLTNVRLGCKITSSNCPDQSGTLGGFIEHPEYGLCAFTCAHVVLNESQKADLKGTSCMKIEDLEKKKIDRKIYQPTIGDDNQIGKLVEVIYKEGENGRPGVDLAIFKIEKRAPTNGKFPDCNSAEAISEQSYNTGLILGRTGISTGNKTVQKFGSVTHHTKGTILFDNMVIKEISFHSKMLRYDERRELTSTLFKQYQVKSNDINRRFSELGDSGALVFMEDSSGEEEVLRCIGMVEAVLDDSSCVVTPITAILDEMKISQLKSFKSNSILNQISKMIDDRMGKLEKRFRILETKVTKLQSKPHQKRQRKRQ